MKKNKIIILGSTGSIGTQTLQCLRFFDDKFEVAGLVCRESRKLFNEQIMEWSPRYSLMTSTVENPMRNLIELVQNNHIDIVVNALSGIIGVEPTIAALKAGKTVLLANKESIVVEGAMIMKIARECKAIGAKIIPLDSEAAGLWQLLRCNEAHVEVENKSAIAGLCPAKMKRVKKIFITASGGPFFGFYREKLSNVTINDALNHPTWKMGKKITIDSATLMNKAFELIECSNLFEIPVEKINVLVDRTSSVHAGVEYDDGLQEWVVYPPDMRTPITDALVYLCRIAFQRFSGDGDGVMPEYVPSLPRIDRSHRSIESGSFKGVDEKVFPALSLAREALKKGRNACAQLCEKNEKAVQDFLNGKIPFVDLLRSH